MIRNTLPLLALALFTNLAQATEPLVAHEWALWHLVQGHAQVMPQVLDTLPAHVHNYAGNSGFPFGTSLDGTIVKKPVAWFYGPEGTVVEYWLRQKNNGHILATFPTPAAWNPSMTTWTLTLGPKNARERAGESGQSPWYGKLYLPQANAVSNPATLETEGFLFYEASVFSSLPVALVAGGLEVREPLPLVLAVFRQASGLAVHFQTALGKTAKWTFPGSLNRMETAQASAELTQRLVSQGLFEAEAKAFAAVWQPELFETPGKRVLVLLPQKTYESLLPVEITPAPTRFVRVGAILVEMP